MNACFHFMSVALCVAVCFLVKPISLKAADPNDSNSPAKLLVKIEPTSPEQALETFQVAPGFHLELAAAEPNVADPVDIAFDESGRMYVAELRDYPFPPKLRDESIGRIRLLEDADRNGSFEKSTLFAEGIHWPSGIAVWKGGIFVTAPPDLLYLKDTDGDGRADVRRVVFTGFGAQSAEDLANNLEWGLDGKIYGVTSYNGGEITHPDRPQASAVTLRGNDFRFDPVTEVLEAIEGGAGDFGQSFDDWGNRFTSNAGAPVMHVALSGESLHKNPHYSPGRLEHNIAHLPGNRIYPISHPEPWRVARQTFWSRYMNTTHDLRAERFSDQELALQGFVTGASGVTIYRGSAFPDSFQNNAFTGEVANNLVIRTVIKPKGVTFQAERVGAKEKEFIASTDNWFRPVNFANGPDGCLYLLDMYRELIEDPSAIPGDILEHLNLTAGMDRGRIYRIVPDGYVRSPSPDLASASSAELVRLLNHPNGWHRATAQRLLLERRDHEAEAVPALRAAALKAHASDLFRLHAIWTLQGLGQLDEGSLLSCLQASQPALRAQAVQLARMQPDLSVRLRSRLREMDQDDSPLVRLQVACALPLLDEQDQIESFVRLATRDGNDHWMRTALLVGVSSHPDRLLQELMQNQRFLASENAAAWLGDLAFMIGLRREKREVQHTANLILTGPVSAKIELGSAILNRFAQGLQRAGGSLADSLQLNGPEEESNSAVLENLWAQNKELAMDADQPVEKRRAAISLLAHAPPLTTQSILSRLMKPQNPAAIQQSAVRALTTASGPDVPIRLVEAWNEASPQLRQTILDALLERPSYTAVLMEALERFYIAPGEIDAVRRQALLQHQDPGLLNRAQQIFEATLNADRQSLINQYLADMKSLPGNPVSGAEVFQQACAQCHAAAGKGFPVGPDLTSLQDRSPETLLMHILDPNRTVSPNYVSYQLTTKDGREVSGILVSENATGITLRKAGGEEETILRSNLLAMNATGLSLMPEGLESGINPRQMADLLAYLATLAP